MAKRILKGNENVPRNVRKKGKIKSSRKIKPRIQTKDNFEKLKVRGPNISSLFANKLQYIMDVQKRTLEKLTTMELILKNIDQSMDKVIYHNNSNDQRNNKSDWVSTDSESVEIEEEKEGEGNIVETVTDD